MNDPKMINVASQALADATVACNAIAFLAEELEAVCPGVRERVAQRLEQLARRPERTNDRMIAALQLLALELRGKK